MRTRTAPTSGQPAGEAAPESTAMVLADDEGTDAIISYSGGAIGDLGGIQDIAPSLQELGKIKIGGLSDQVRQTQGGKDWRPPVKYDHFVITRNERGADGRLVVDDVMMGILGEKPRSIDVVLLSDDIFTNFATYYGMYAGRKMLCCGNGKVASRVAKDAQGKPDFGAPKLDVNCTCESLVAKTCKPHGILSVMLAQSPVLGGIYKFRTTSIITIRQITGSLRFIYATTGGRLAGLPLRMTLTPMTVDVTDPKGGPPKATTIYTVNLVYAGDGEKLMRNIIETMDRRMKLQIDMAKIEGSVKGLLAAAPDEEEEAEVEALQALPPLTGGKAT